MSLFDGYKIKAFVTFQLTALRSSAELRTKNSCLQMNKGTLEEDQSCTIDLDKLI